MAASRSTTPLKTPRLNLRSVRTATQNRRDVGALQAGRGGNPARRGGGLARQKPHHHAFGLRQRQCAFVAVAAELDFAGNDQNEIGQVGPTLLGAGPSITVAF
ncbi:hypothetical protein ACFSQT_14680 [Mesorhizobium calcicola]|uniref:Uncharacterized protein n=1 Tax=Mesorhizobium calcicola TaxID=1300310 RepID=A0ABW4WFI1_9HYPH